MGIGQESGTAGKTIGFIFSFTLSISTPSFSSLALCSAFPFPFLSRLHKIPTGNKCHMNGLGEDKRMEVESFDRTAGVCESFGKNHLQKSDLIFQSSSEEVEEESLELEKKELEKDSLSLSEGVGGDSSHVNFQEPSSLQSSQHPDPGRPSSSDSSSESDSDSPFMNTGPLIRIRTEEELGDEDYHLKQRFKLKEISIVVRRLSPRQLELLRRKAELEKLLAQARCRKRPSRATSKKDKATLSHEEEILCPAPDCGYKGKFQTQSELEIHKKRYHEGVKKPYECQTCSKSFITQRMLEDHMNTHRGEKPYLCSDCGWTFSAKDLLDRHLRKRHSASTRKHIFTCKHCRDKFESRKLWELHSITHLPPEEQAEASRTQEERKGKTKRMPGEKKLTCEYCNFKVSYPSQLQEHLLVHTNQRAYSCEVCGESFKRNRALRLHMAVHSEDRPFLCPHCGKAFKLNKGLKKHLHLHESEKAHKCPLCPKGYQTRSLLTQHMISHKKKGHVFHPLDQPSEATPVANLPEPPPFVPNVHPDYLNPYNSMQVPYP